MIGRGPVRGLLRSAAVPGLVLAAAVAAAAWFLARWIGTGLLGYSASPLSPILLAVFLGLVVGHTAGLPARFRAGIDLAARRVLRFGVALLGIRLSIVAVAKIGLVALPIVGGCILAALIVVAALKRLLRIPPRLGSLIAAGTSVCGITAVVALAPAIEARDDETSYAVATVALFGMIALFAYPFLAHALFDDPTRAGLFLGTSIHDTSQVVGAGMAYSQQFAEPAALEAAVVTKMLRNLSLIAVLPLLTHIHGTQASGDHGGARPTVPLFLFGFLALAVVRTLGDLGDAAFGIVPPEVWAGIVGWIQTGAGLALLLAMAAVGLGTRVGSLHALGLRPVAVGLAAALTVGAVSVALIHAFGTVSLL